MYVCFSKCGKQDTYAGTTSDIFFFLILGLVPSAVLMVKGQ